MKWLIVLMLVGCGGAGETVAMHEPPSVSGGARDSGGGVVDPGGPMPMPTPTTMPPPVPTSMLDRTVPNCPEYPTVKLVEVSLMGQRCASCHARVGGQSAPDLQSPGIYLRLVDARVSGLLSQCDRTQDVYLASQQDVGTSYFVNKVTSAAPRCWPSGRPGGSRCPFGGPDLSAADQACLIGYAQVISR